MRYSIVLTAVLASLGLASDVLELKEDTLQGFVEEHDLSLIECKWPPCSTSYLGTMFSSLYFSTSC
jgi:protein disulfide-isomerase A1